MSDPTRATSEQRLRCGIHESRQILLEGRSTVVELVQDVLLAIRETDPALGAYVKVAEEGALREAEAADRLLSTRGEAALRERPLLGVPVSVKDLIQTRDLPTSRGSLLPNPRPAVDAPSVARLRRAGAIVVGKTTTSEHGWSASTVSPAAPPTRNPWALDRSPGGSSGGAAAAVAAGLCTVSLGTDGAGSVRIPAAFCGVVGFKPSYARIPYVPPSPEGLSHVGPLARSVADVAELMPILAGPDPRDPDSMTPPPVPPAPGAPLRIGWIEFPGTTDAVRDVTEGVLPVLAALGHRVERAEVPFEDPYPILVDILAGAEADGTSPGDDPWCDEGRLAVVRYGRSLGSAAVARAEQGRRVLVTRLAEVMRSYDLLAMATVPIGPFAADAIGPAGAARPESLRWLAWSPATYPFNFTGQPALSLPVGLDPAGLPVGLQLVGRVGDDDLVLSAAGLLETALGLSLTPPRIPTRGR